METAPAISIIGFHRSVLGLGEDARTLAQTCLRLNIRPELVDVSPPTLERNREPEAVRTIEAAAPSAHTVVFCLPPGDMQRACDLLGLESYPKLRRRIGYWPWETSSLPRAFNQAFSLVDEIWASSRFLLDLYRRCSNLPVRHVPLSVSVAAPTLTPELESLFDGRLTILSVFDFHSRIARKNPLGAVEAFRRAFPLGTEPVQLLLKTINGERRPGDLAAVLAATFADPRIAVVDGAVSRSALCGLVAASDVYLSLHRAEGFGRPIVEAMLLGTPVVATQWSGPADILDETTGYPVTSYLRPVQAGEYPDAAGCWAEPDVDQAARYLATLHADPTERRRTCDAAERRAVSLFGPAAVDRALRKALLR